MTIWQKINEKWNTLPPDSVAEEFKPRLMLHLSHAGWLGVIPALVGWELTRYGVELWDWIPLIGGMTYVGRWWHWAIGVVLYMFLRELRQHLTINERMWSCLFDTVQTLPTFFVMLLVQGEVIWSGVSLLAFLVLYVVFLLRDEDWIED